MQYLRFLLLGLLIGVMLLLPRGAQAYAWETVRLDAVGDVGEFTSIAVDANGDPMISYFDLSNEDLKFAICDLSASRYENCDQAGDWITAVVDAVGAAGWRTSIALDTNGDPMISYFDLTSDDLNFAICDRSESGNGSCDEAGDWSTAVADAAGAVHGTSMAIDANGDPMIAYGYGRRGSYDLKFAYCDLSSSFNGNCDQAFDWTAVTVDVAGSAGEYASIAVDANGDPVISYWDRTNNDLKFAICDLSPTGCGWSTVTVDSAGDVGMYTSIAVDAGGNPMISYYAGSDLKFAVCALSTSANGNCDQAGDWNGVILDEEYDVGEFTSIAVDTNGDPMISYFDFSNEDLKFAYCDLSTSTNGNCDQTGDWSTETVDAAGYVGMYTSIAVDASGNPMISYRDFGVDNDLKFATAAPRLDSDGDGWTDWSEVSSIGTDPFDACPDDPSDEAHPADMNNDTFFDISDIVAVAGWFGAAVPPAPPRHDVAPDPPDGIVDITDIVAVAGLFGQSCTP